MPIHHEGIQHPAPNEFDQNVRVELLRQQIGDLQRRNAFLEQFAPNPPTTIQPVPPHYSLYHHGYDSVHSRYNTMGPPQSGVCGVGVSSRGVDIRHHEMNGNMMHFGYPSQLNGNPIVQYISDPIQPHCPVPQMAVPIPRPLSVPFSGSLQSTQWSQDMTGNGMGNGTVNPLNTPLESSSDSQANHGDVTIIIPPNGVETDMSSVMSPVTVTDNQSVAMFPDNQSMIPPMIPPMMRDVSVNSCSMQYDPNMPSFNQRWD